LIPLNATAKAALAQGNVNLVQLLRLNFPNGEVVALNSSNIDFTHLGTVYKGAFGLGSISEIQDSPGEIKGIQFTLNGGSADLIAVALDDSKQWQGTSVEIRTAVLNDQYQIVDAPLAWSGLGDVMSIAEEDNTTVIQATAESSAVDFMRGDPLVYNHADQQVLYPGDLGFNLILSQVDKQVVWPSRSWFHK
jgi:hypothetical protein